ncbi:MAG TPA: N-acetyltransferase [Anaerolineales bacterium]|nr:N-acetyltransferase [Anaerolineales bacterium]
MDYEIISLSQLEADQLKQLAQLHHSVMHTLLADLGLPMVLRYYQIARSDNSVVGMCVLDSSKKIIGWAMGSPHPDRINSALRSPLLWFAFQMLRVLFTRPLILLQLISSILSSSAETEMKSDAIELTYIGVAANQRSKGLGKDLLNTFIETSREAGYRSVVLSVEKDNEAAIALYQKAGFKITKTFSEGRFERHRMEWILE